MDKMYKVKMGAIVKIVPAGALKWYIQANWKEATVNTPLALNSWPLYTVCA